MHEIFPIISVSLKCLRSTNSSDKKVAYKTNHDIFQTFLLAVICLFVLIIFNINCYYKWSKLKS